MNEKIELIKYAYEHPEERLEFINAEIEKLEEKLKKWRKEKSFLLGYLNRDNNQKKLTKRAIDVCNLLIKGLSNKEMAQKMDITANTVKKHISNILKKTSIKDRLKLILALKNGLLDDDYRFNKDYNEV